MTSKAEVDKHVETLVAKLPLKEFKSRAYSIAMLYWRAGDYASARRYVEQYLTHREGDAAAHKLLAQSLHRLGEKEKALEQYKTALEIDPKQTALILDICELLSDDEVHIDPGRARYWCERAEVAYPRHPATFGLRERLLSQANADPAALLALLTSELRSRPKDAVLHARLLRLHLKSSNYNDAFQHAFDVEFGEQDTFRTNIAWYDVLAEVLALFAQGGRADDWHYRLFELTVAERTVALALTEIPAGAGRSLSEAGAALQRYDRELFRAAAPAASPPGTADFYVALLQHHRAQFSLHAACYLLKKAKKDQLNWRDATRPAAPLLLHAWHATPLPPTASWLTQAPERQRIAARRWYLEGASRCSQAGHCLLAGVQERGHSFVDRVSQFCSGNQWKDKLYEKLFTGRDQQTMTKESHLLSEHFSNPMLRLPRRSEVQAYDVDAQKMHPSSLHHMVWMLINYKSYAHFKCVIFDMLRPASQNYPNCGPETLNKRDAEAFLYAAALTSNAHDGHPRHTNYQAADRPQLLPACITDPLCSLTQMKWWDCACKVSQNEIGMELNDIRVTLRRGIEAVRCVDNHGLDPQLLCRLAGIFSERASTSNLVDEKDELVARAALYYSSAIPLLERLKSKMTIRLPDKRIFEYTSKDLNSKEIAALLEESKLFLGEYYMNENEHEKAVDTLTGLKSPHSSLLLSKIYNKMAFEEIGTSKEHLTSEDRSKHIILLSKAKDWAYTTSERLKGHLDDKLKLETQVLIEKIENAMSRIDPDMSNTHDYEANSTDENDSSGDSHGEPMHLPIHMRSVFRINSSTPKHRTNSNATQYRSALDSHTLDVSRSDHKHFERIESQIKTLNKENRNLGDEVRDLKNNLADKIISSINTNIQDTVDQFKLLKLSVDQVKEKIGEYRDESRSDVGDLRKEVADLKKEVSKLKSSSNERTIAESDLYNLEEELQASESATAFPAQLAFGAPPGMPAFNTRMVPPVLPPAAYASIYGQNLYTLYNQFAQLPQPAPAPAAPLFDPARHPHYPAVFPPTDPIYPDVSHFIHPAVVPPPVPPVVTHAPPPPVVTRPAVPQNKEVPRSIPVNVVITSSDPLPIRTTAPQPVLSVTVPPQHIKSSPHNYQIQLPASTDSSIGFPGNGTTMKMFSSASSNTTVSWTPQVSSTFDSPKTTASLFDTPKLDLSGLNASFASSPNASLNKSRTLSERSNTSVDNYDPCPDFKPIIPLPAEVQVTTGEEEETSIFCARAKLYRFADKQWKERGLGEMKLLKHKVTGKVRVLMRREQVHKICANHIITSEMDLQLMKNETKAYVWVANDFADETVQLEKFCIRFKTVDIAKEFYDTFERARKEAKATKSSNKSSIEKKSEVKTVGFGDKFKPLAGSWNCPVCYVSNPSGSVKCVACQSENPTLLKATTAQVSTEKTVVGGFTFSGTPTFKPAKETDTKVVKSEETSTKPNPFSALSFKTQTSSPFANIFNVAPAVNPETPKSTASPAATDKDSSQLNTSDVVEEFEPAVEFKPVVPLPALVEQKTGEEDETVTFEHRSKLLRFDSASKEWKERGLGNIKILINKNNSQKVRLLMRREIVMKVCCNHSITKDMKFQKMPNQDKAVTWCAKDFSEGELTAETFCLRFKTADICDDFIKAAELAQQKMSSEIPKDEITEQQNILASDKKEKSESSNLPVSVANWGDKFKPKAGSWECAQCLIRNEAHLEYCSACESPKDPSKPKESKSIFDGAGTTKFTFGIPQSVTDASKATPPIGATFGVTNNATPPSGITFGITNKATPPAGITFGVTNKATPPTGISFGDTNKLTPPTGITFGVTNKATPPTGLSFGVTNKTTPSTGITFGVSNKATPSTEVNNQSTPAVSFSFAPTVATSQKAEESSRTMSFGNFGATKTQSPFSTPVQDVSFAKESGTFEFVMKPKSPGKGKSPLKSPQSDGGEVSDDDGYGDDGGDHIHFAPVIPLPDKVEVTTGEEHENELYSHRAKLFRFVAGEWKERGIGNVKILKHKENKKLRVLMRREQIHKICLNHALTPEVNYQSKDEKTWLFTANDFSEGEINLHQFCLRFKNKDIAAEFKRAVDDARSGVPENSKKEDLDDVVFVQEIVATPEEKLRAAKLMLPENFYTYERRAACPGCRGCDDHSSGEETAPVAPATPIASTLVSTAKSTPSSSSPTSSMFTTPMAMNRTTDTSIFRTPMGYSDDDKTLSDSKTFGDKENTFTQKSSNDGVSGDNTPKSSNQTLNNVSNVLGNKNADASLAIKSSLLAPPKLSTSNSSETGNVKPEVKSIFGSVGESKPTFGISAVPKPEAKSVFGSVGDQKLGSVFGTAGTQNLEGKSIFGLTSDQTPATIFGTASTQKPESKSFFGSTTGLTPGAVFGATSIQKSEAKPVFGSATGQSPATIFGAASNQKSEAISLFGSTAGQTPSIIFGSASNQKPETKSLFGSTIDQTPASIFGGVSNEKPEEKIVFGANVDQKSDPKNLFGNQKTESLFGFPTVQNQNINPVFGLTPTEPKSKFGSSAVQSTSIFGGAQATNGNTNSSIDFSKSIFGAASDTAATTPSLFSQLANAAAKSDEKSEASPAPFSTDGSLSFAALLSSGNGISAKKSDNFQWEGAGQQLFGQKGGAKDTARADGSKDASALEQSGSGEGAEGNAEEEYDPHYEPIVPLPDKIEVTTGEEDEEKLFGERAKIYRYDDKAREWKERGVGELKLLHHPARNTYRLLLRREQVHKAVLNTLLFKDLELLPLKNSDRAWTWASVNYAETAAGDMETLACRFKSVELANTFRDRVVEAVRRLQAADAAAVREARERGASALPASAERLRPAPEPAPAPEPEPEVDEYDGGGYEPYDEDYEYSNEDEEQVVVAEASGAALVAAEGEPELLCTEAALQLLLEQDMYGHRLMVTEASTGEILADTVLCRETPLQVSGKTASWSGTDYMTGEAVEKTVTFTFQDGDACDDFYETLQNCRNDTG